MITNTPPLEQGKQWHIYVIMSFLYIEYVSDLFVCLIWPKQIIIFLNVSFMFDKIHCFNVSFNGYLPSSALSIIFLVEMFKTPRSLLRNCKWTLSTSVLSQVKKLYFLYGFQKSLPLHKSILNYMDSRNHCHKSIHLVTVKTFQCHINLYLLFRANMALVALRCRSS